jgi:hypothetical protein
MKNSTTQNIIKNDNINYKLPINKPIVKPINKPIVKPINKPIVKPIVKPNSYKNLSINKK